jgi:hypothetical protein
MVPAAAGGSGSGSVTSVSVASANGFAGTVANPTTTPAITMETSITGLLKGNGTAVSEAVSGTDYLTPTGSGASLTGITASQVGALPSTDDLSAIASANATAGNVAMNSHKITGLANGTAATDAAAFGQILGGQAEYNAVTANYASTASASTWTAADALSGAKPSITLPNDGNTYQVEFFASIIESGTAVETSVGLGTGAATIDQLAIFTIDVPLAASKTGIYFKTQNIIGSGQTIAPYVFNTTGGITITFSANAVGTSNASSPSWLAAYRVA